MKKYNNRETAPLAYHSLFLYIGLPFSIITNALAAYNNLTFLSYGTELFIYSLLDFIFTFVLTILCCVTFWGLRKWKAYSWYSIYALISTLSIYSMLIIFLYAGIGITDFAEFVEPIGKIIFSIIIAIYYWKRKGLFFDPETSAEDSVTIPSEQALQQEIVETSASAMSEPVPESAETIKETEEPSKKEHPSDDFIIETYPPAAAKPVKKKPVALIVCVVALICSLIGNVYQFSSSAAAIEKSEMLSRELASLQSRYTTKEADAEKYYKKYSEMKDAYNFYDNYAVIVPEYSQRYHKHGCQYLDTSSFWIYNTEAAKSNGYIACPHCFTD